MRFNYSSTHYFPFPAVFSHLTVRTQSTAKSEPVQQALTNIQTEICICWIAHAQHNAVFLYYTHTVECHAGSSLVSVRLQTATLPRFSNIARLGDQTNSTQTKNRKNWWFYETNSTWLIPNTIFILLIFTSKTVNTSMLLRIVYNSIVHNSNSYYEMRWCRAIASNHHCRAASASEAPHTNTGAERRATGAFSSIFVLKSMCGRFYYFRGRGRMESVVLSSVSFSFSHRRRFHLRTRAMKFVVWRCWLEFVEVVVSCATCIIAFVETFVHVIKRIMQIGACAST